MKIAYVGGPLHRKTCNVGDEEAPAAVAFFDLGVPVHYFLASSSEIGLSPLDVAALMPEPDVDTEHVYVFGGATP